MRLPRVLRCPCRRDNESNTRLLTLRFKENQAEAGFLVQRKGQLVESLKGLLPIPLTFYVLGIIMNFVMSKHDQSSFPSHGAYVSQQVEIVCDGAMAIMTLCSLLLLRRRSVVERLNTLALELGAVALLALMLLQLSLGAPQTVSRLLGHDMEATYGKGWCGSDTTLVLKIDLVVTATHLGPRVRWFLCTIIAWTGILLYAANTFVIGSQEPMGNSAYNMLLLTALILAASLSKRIAEQGERKAFQEIIYEKSLRCAAEFKLSQSRSWGSDMPEPSPGHPRSIAETSSIPTAAASGIIFDPLFEEGVDLRSQLARITDMGETEHWLINRSEVKLLREDLLGRGSYGIVCKGIFCGNLVAVKCPHKSLDANAAQWLPDFCNELRVLRRLRHPNIVAAHGAMIDVESEKISLVLELVAGSALDTFMFSQMPGPFVRYQVMLGICRALIYMHTRNPHVVHGDLKSGNIIVETVAQDRFVHPRLLDFGLSRIVTQSARPLGGTMVWMAPEVLQRTEKVRCSADVYSFGRLLAFVATSIPPLSGLSSQQIRRALGAKMPMQPAWPHNCAFKGSLKQVVHKCIRAEPHRRPHVQEVHARLLAVPEELDLRGEPAFLEDVQTVRRHTEPEPDEEPGSNSSLAVATPAQAVVSNLELDQFTLLQEAPTVPSLRDELKVVPEGEELPANADEQDTRGPQILLHPGMQITDPSVMAALMLELITRWNFRVAAPPCCQLHAGARMAQQIVSQLLAHSCIEQHIDVGCQCQSCGMLGLEQNAHTCSTCRTERSSQLGNSFATTSVSHRKMPL